MFLIVGLFAVGLLLIILGGDKFVDASVVIARKIGLPDVVIGATIVSLGTTMPEILVSTLAGFSGNGDVAVGNALGSIICNASLIGGLVLVFLPPNIMRKSFNWRAVYFFVLTGLFTLFAFWDLKISLVEGLALLFMFALYAFITIKQSGSDKDTEKSGDETPLLKSLGILGVTSIMMFIGAKLLVDNGIEIALALGVPERVVAVTFIALGTSLPELVTAITSIRKKFTAISIGNIVGANLINYMGVIAIPAVLSGINVSAAVFSVDIPLAIFVMALLALPPMFTGKTYRWQGFALLATYCTYTIMLFR